jgi:hypothetical protein
MAMIRENSSVPSQLRTYGDVATRAMFREITLNGGTTIDLSTFKVPGATDGYFVGAATGWDGNDIPAQIIPLEEFTLERLRRAFGFLYAEHLTREEITNSTPIEGGFIGAWIDNGLVYVDATDWTPSYEQAVEWAVARGELAIYDVQADGSLEIATIMADRMVAA